MLRMFYNFFKIFVKFLDWWRELPYDIDKEKSLSKKREKSLTNYEIFFRDRKTVYFNFIPVMIIIIYLIIKIV